LPIIVSYGLLFSPLTRAQWTGLLDLTIVQNPPADCVNPCAHYANNENHYVWSKAQGKGIIGIRVYAHVTTQSHAFTLL
jgi:hypothetical protein